MIERLPYPTKEQPDPRGELDASLHVAAWRRPGQPAQPDGVPAWWRGEEEASGSFLREMGVDLTRLSG